MWISLKSEYANAKVATVFALELKLRELKYKSIHMDWNQYRVSQKSVDWHQFLGQKTHDIDEQAEGSG